MRAEGAAARKWAAAAWWKEWEGGCNRTACLKPWPCRLGSMPTAQGALPTPPAAARLNRRAPVGTRSLLHLSTCIRCVMPGQPTRKSYRHPLRGMASQGATPRRAASGQPRQGVRRVQGRSRCCRAAARSGRRGHRPVQEGVARLKRLAGLGAAGRQVARAADSLRLLTVQQHGAAPRIADAHHHALQLAAVAAAICRRRGGRRGGAGRGPRHAGPALLQACGPPPPRLGRCRDGLPPRLAIHLHVRLPMLALDLRGRQAGTVCWSHKESNSPASPPAAMHLAHQRQQRTAALALAAPQPHSGQPALPLPPTAAELQLGASAAASPAPAPRAAAPPLDTAPAALRAACC